MKTTLRLFGSLLLFVGGVITIRLINRTTDIWFEKHKNKVTKWVKEF